VMPAPLVADIARELHGRTVREQEGTGAMSLSALGDSCAVTWRAPAVLGRLPAPS
jgi:hypothetical protein